MHAGQLIYSQLSCFLCLFFGHSIVNMFFLTDFDWELKKK